MVKYEQRCRMQTPRGNKLMPKKKSTDIVPLFSNPLKGLLAREATLEIGLNPDEQAQDVYKSDYVLQLKEEIKSLSNAKEQIAYLKAFRDLLSGYCFKITGPVTIIHCSELWNAKKCKYAECETRNGWKPLFL